MYLSIGVVPGYAQRDLDIMGLLGQVSLSPENLQNVTKIVKDHLIEYPIEFPGWSGLVRRTAAKYPELPDPLQYMNNPWRPDRWRMHCKKIIFQHWDQLLISSVKEQQEQGHSLELFDVSNLSATRPHKIWSAAGKVSSEVTKACIVSWMLLGVYYTRTQLHKFKKVDSAQCIFCKNGSEESLFHILLFCESYEDIRIPYFSKLNEINPGITSYLNQPKLLTIAILDPESNFLPAAIKDKWLDLNESYRLARHFCFNVHKKREKITKKIEEEKNLASKNAP